MSACFGRIKHGQRLTGKSALRCAVLGHSKPGRSTDAARFDNAAWSAKLGTVSREYRALRSRVSIGRAFTLIELLVVISVIAILAALLLPTLDKGKLKAWGVQCMNNHRLLTLAWRMYAEDNSGVLVYA